MYMGLSFSLMVCPGRVSPNNRMQRSGKDKVHAPDCSARFNISDYAPKVRRAVADAGRYAASKSHL